MSSLSPPVICLCLIFISSSTGNRHPYFLSSSLRLPASRIHSRYSLVARVVRGTASYVRRLWEILLPLNPCEARLDDGFVCLRERERRRRGREGGLLWLLWWLNQTTAFSSVLPAATVLWLRLHRRSWCPVPSSLARHHTAHEWKLWSWRIMSLCLH